MNPCTPLPSLINRIVPLTFNSLLKSPESFSAFQERITLLNFVFFFLLLYFTTLLHVWYSMFYLALQVLEFF